MADCVPPPAAGTAFSEVAFGTPMQDRGTLANKVTGSLLAPHSTGARPPCRYRPFVISKMKYGVSPDMSENKK
jgi:hypothetical protein